MKGAKPTYYDSVAGLVDDIIDRFDGKILFGMPIGLGKSYHIANEMYRRAKADPGIRLTLVTALSLEKPAWSGDLERRMIEPLRDRIWKDVPDFDYMTDLRENRLPPNVTIREFYFKAGSAKGDPEAQQNHYSSNYTHVGRDIMTGDGDNILYCHTVAKKVIDGRVYYSDSSNADLSLDIKRYSPKAEAAGKKFLHVVHVNDSLPFMYGDAVNSEDHFDMILEGEEFQFPLFSVPKAPVSTADHMIGIHVSALIRDGGSLQIGIGSLGDAIASALILRHRDNHQYRRLLDELEIRRKFGGLVEHIGGTNTFEKGLYGTTEMLVDAFMELYKAGIIKRRVYDDPSVQKLLNEGRLAETLTTDAVRRLLSEDRFHPVLKAGHFRSLQKTGVFREGLTYSDYAIVNGRESYSADLRDPENLERILQNCIGDTLKNGVICHGGFFIGPRQFYDDLNGMPEEERRLFAMTGVSVVNQLYGDEELKALQRRDARLVNTAMKISIFGNICSDALEDGTVISGVGGQYDFVAQGHALEGARVIMMLKAVRETPAGPESNIVFNYGYTTIPRHLKDIVVTEYGIADLRGKVDHEVVAAIINIADSRFQDALVEKARQALKLPADYRVPEAFRYNYPERLQEKLEQVGKSDNRLFQAFPFGTDLTDEEIALGQSLRGLKSKLKHEKFRSVAGLIRQMLTPVPDAAAPYLERMQLDAPGTFREKIARKAVTYALKSAGHIRAKSGG